jgi:hypothetical protein
MCAISSEEIQRYLDTFSKVEKYVSNYLNMDYHFNVTISFNKTQLSKII